jgi:hypothetical protein
MFKKFKNLITIIIKIFKKYLKRKIKIKIKMEKIKRRNFIIKKSINI